MTTTFLLGPGKNVIDDLSTGAGRVKAANVPAGTPGCDTPSQVRLAQLAARAWLRQHRTFSEYNSDASTIHCGTTLYLNGRVRQDLERTAIWQRGEEIHELLSGPVILAHLDQHLQQCCSATLAFEGIHHREPKAGDVLRFEDVVLHETAVHEWLLPEFAAAWKRQLPELFYPLRFENGKLYYRDFHEQWQENEHIQPQYRWRHIESDALGSITDEPSLEVMPTFPAVVFLGVIDGKHRCKPAGPEA